VRLRLQNFLIEQTNAGRYQVEVRDFATSVNSNADRKPLSFDRRGRRRLLCETIVLGERSGTRDGLCKNRDNSPASGLPAIAGKPPWTTRLSQQQHSATLTNSFK
jgi:hypothetical protein